LECTALHKVLGPKHQRREEDDAEDEASDELQAPSPQADKASLALEPSYPEQPKFVPVIHFDPEPRTYEAQVPKHTLGLRGINEQDTEVFPALLHLAKF